MVMAAVEERENRRTKGEEEEEAMTCPSFRIFSATAQDSSFLSPSPAGVDVDGDDRLSNSDFEFSTHISGNSPADRRSYLVFGEEKILKVAEESESESGDDDLDGVLLGAPCVCLPGAKVLKKCRSMGSGLSRRWRLRDLVFGRSRSDGKEKFSLQRMHLAPAWKTKAAAEVVVEEKEKSKKKEREGVSDLGGGRRGVELYRKEGDRRRTSFLPYRTDLVALFPPGRRSRTYF